MFNFSNLLFAHSRFEIHLFKYKICFVVCFPLEFGLSVFRKNVHNQLQKSVVVVAVASRSVFYVLFSWCFKWTGFYLSEKRLLFVLCVCVCFFLKKMCCFILWPFSIAWLLPKKMWIAKKRDEVGMKKAVDFAQRRLRKAFDESDLNRAKTMC